MEFLLEDTVEFQSVMHSAASAGASCTPSTNPWQAFSTDTLGSDPREMEQHELQRVGQPDYSVTREQTA